MPENPENCHDAKSVLPPIRVVLLRAPSGADNSNVAEICSRDPQISRLTEVRSLAPILEDAKIEADVIVIDNGNISRGMIRDLRELQARGSRIICITYEQTAHMQDAAILAAGPGAGLVNAWVNNFEVDDVLVDAIHALAWNANAIAARWG
jgi:hypothetical protein